MYRLNSRNRIYPTGVELDESIKQLIVEQLQRNGSDVTSGNIPRSITTKVANHCCVSRRTVVRVWKKYLSYGTCDFECHRGRPIGSGRLLDESDEEYVHFLLKGQPSIFRKEVRDKLYEVSNTLHPRLNPVSLSTINRTIATRLPDGKYSRKKLQRSNSNRWTDRNIVYTRDFLAHMRSLDPNQILFYDESSFSSGNCHRYYGSSPVGQRAVEVSKHYAGDSHTLFLLCGLNGKVFGKVTEGNSDTYTFITFILEALQSHTDDGELIIQPNFTLVGDNAKIHRYRGEELLHEFLDPFNVDIVFLPVSSPCFNPCEFAFSFLKTMLKREPLSSIVQNDVQSAVLESVCLLTNDLIYSFFKGVSTNFMRL